MDARIYQRDRGPADATEAGGAYARDQRFGRPMGTDSWSLRSGQSQRAHSGSGHAKRFGVKPSGGKIADIHVGRPKISAEDRLRSARAEAKRLGDGQGRCHRLIDAAAALVSGSLPPQMVAEVRKQCQAEVIAVATYGGPSANVAEEVRAAIGFRITLK